MFGGTTMGGIRMSGKPDLDNAYRLNGPEDTLGLYRDWAATYDADFGEVQGYRLPMEVARAFVEAGGTGPVLDIGAGTGLVAEGLLAAEIGPLDAVDLSPDMLKIAAKKGLYRTLHCADVTAVPNLPGGPYAGLVSAGTFTLGHLGAEALPALFAFGKVGTLCVISVNAMHYASAGFETMLARHAERISDLSMQDVRIYTDRADPAHRMDMARLLVFRLA
jgi:SAM-dependent methyltransferase